MTHWRVKDNRIGLLFVLPFVLAGIVFMLYPVVDAARMSLMYINPLMPEGNRFAGLANFEFIFADRLFWVSFANALYWTFFFVLLQTVLGVGLGLLLHRTLTGISFFRGLLLFPYIVPTVVIALCWQWMLNPEIGIVNQTLKQTGVISADIYWLSSPGMAMWSTILLNVWKYTPFVTICVLARLQTIPLELYDAAKIDGAGTIRRFFDITLPQLAEVLAVVVVFRTSWTFNKFEEIYLLTRGGPGTSTFNLAIYSFEQSIANLKMGVGAATGVVMMFLLFVGSLVYLKLFRFDED